MTSAKIDSHLLLWYNFSVVSFFNGIIFQKTIITVKVGENGQTEKTKDTPECT